MPTGYTAALDDVPEMSLAEWVKTRLVLAFGCCYALRESNWEGLTPEKIEKEIVSYHAETIHYHEKKLKDAQKCLKTFKERTPDLWRIAHAEYAKKMMLENAKSVREHEAIKTRHDEARVFLKHFIGSGQNPATVRVAEFGLEQLDLCKSDETPYIVKPISLVEFRRSEVGSTKRDIEYHGEGLTKARQRVEEAITTYRVICADVEVA